MYCFVINSTVKRVFLKFLWLRSILHVINSTRLFYRVLKREKDLQLKERRGAGKCKRYEIPLKSIKIIVNVRDKRASIGKRFCEFFTRSLSCLPYVLSIHPCTLSRLHQNHTSLLSRKLCFSPSESSRAWLVQSANENSPKLDGSFRTAQSLPLPFRRRFRVPKFHLITVVW